MTKILNTWTSTPKKKQYYELGEEIYRNGDYAVYCEMRNSYIYSFKNVAINNLGGFNKDHVDRLATNNRPEGKYDQRHFLFDRAMESKEKGLALL